MIKITVMDTPSLGNRSYLASDGRVALAIDPPRDIDLVIAAAEDLDVTITHVFETHVHNDYITGGLALARQVGASYCLNAADHVSFERTGLRDADVLELGAHTGLVEHAADRVLEMRDGRLGEATVSGARIADGSRT